jgi:hypothetical protein
MEGVAQLVEGGGERGSGRRATGPVGVGTAARHGGKFADGCVHGGNPGGTGQHDDAAIEEFADLHAPPRKGLGRASLDIPDAELLEDEAQVGGSLHAPPPPDC